MKKTIYLIMLMAMLIGCATADITKGMSKEQVRAKLGNPTVIKNNKNSCCKREDEECWYYFSTYKQRKKPRRSIVFMGDVVEYAFRWR